MMSQFRGCETLVKMVMMNIMFLFFFFLLGAPLMAATRAETNNPVVEFASREELVQMAGYGEEKLSTVTIVGQVLCHGGCVGEEAQLRPLPVSGASVAVFCGKCGKRRKSSARSTTDANGEFHIDLPSHLHAIPNIEKICHVHVLNLPKHSHCRPAFTGKVKGIKLSWIDDGARTYTAEKIHLTPKPSKACRNGGGKNEETAHAY